MPLVFYTQPDLWSALNAEHAQRAQQEHAQRAQQAANANAAKPHHMPSLPERVGFCRPNSAAAAAAAASVYAEAAACGRPSGAVMSTPGRPGTACALDLFKVVKSEGRSAFDLIEKEAAYQLVVNAPGLDARDITIDLEGQVLTISGKKQPATEEAPEEEQQQQEQEQQKPQRQADKWEVVPSSSSSGEDEDGKVEDADDASDTKAKTGHESPATSSAAVTPATSPKAAAAPAPAAATAAAPCTKSSSVRVLFSERCQPSFARAFKLPGNVVANSISASLDRGVLTVTVPKTPEKPKPQPTRIKLGQHRYQHHRSTHIAWRGAGGSLEQAARVLCAPRPRKHPACSEREQQAQQAQQTQQAQQVQQAANADAVPSKPKHMPCFPAATEQG
ncbi:hypothetical protein FOA52_005448 [Chlamydomonas sp. UWO 241]|nr:hypothetical protein FOA52_005448 [Chlamydomonas sp. UWO 241]